MRSKRQAEAIAIAEKMPAIAGKLPFKGAAPPFSRKMAPKITPPPMAAGPAQMPSAVRMPRHQAQLGNLRMLGGKLA